MTSGDRTAAEVRAARRALGDSPAPGYTPAVTQPGGGPPLNPDVDHLLDEMLAADQVDILGVLPWQCAARLQRLETLRLEAGRPVIHRQQVRYFTPARDRISLYRQPGVLGMLVQRWIAGLTGLRNWLLSSVPADGTADSLTVYEFDELYLDCLVYTRTGEGHSVTVLSQLPLLASSDRPGAADETLVITRMAEDQVAEFRKYLSSLVTQVAPLQPRQILCRAEDADREPRGNGSEFTPVISEILSYGQRRPAGSVVPVAVVAVRVRTAKGPSLLLKLRTERNSRDDWGRLSLISERVLVEDLTAWLTQPLEADPVHALDTLWLRAGEPEPFELPESAFRKAAQRELFLSCGLDVADDRLELCGSCLLDREDEETSLGFFVYRLDLDRSAAFDELRHARRWSPDLRLVALSELYLPDRREKLNRLLRGRDVWLQENVFRP